MNERPDEYLDAVGARLRWIPAARREDELTEARAHLEQSIAARVAAGLQETEATAETIRQFGPPRDIAAGIRRAYLREWLTHGSGGILVSFLIMYAVWKTLGPALSYAFFRVHDFPVTKAELVAIYTPYGVAALWWLIRAAVGFVGGCITPRRALEGATFCFAVSILESFFRNAYASHYTLSWRDYIVIVYSYIEYAPWALLPGLFWLIGAMLGKQLRGAIARCQRA